MLSWLRDNNVEQTKNQKAQLSVAQRLAKLYEANILPFEREFHFDRFYSPSWSSATFSAKPMVLLIGQYSTGKTTFIRHLIGREYPGCRIGPEPTTDKFVIVTAGSKDRSVPGNAVVVDPALPFTQLSNFGNNFLNKLECVQLKDNEVVEGITLVDTPGVLSGEKQTVQRNYDFNAVVRWFADNSDLIIILWDANKLDIYDEMKKVITTLKHNTAKIRIVLNKADSVNSLHLMQVNGALMWSLGKTLETPEVPRVYMGSFWDKPLQNSEYRMLFETEQTELFKDLAVLPRSGVLTKLNQLVTRARQARAHAYLLTHLNAQLPALWGRTSAQKRMVEDLEIHVNEVCEKFAVNQGDFPPFELLKEKLPSFDFTTIGKLRDKDLKALEVALNEEIPRLLLALTKEDDENGDSIGFLDDVTHASPFTQESSYREQNVFTRIPNPDEYVSDFQSIGPDEDGRITGLQAKENLVKSNLPSTVLHKIWSLADINKDGFLDLFEYATARELIRIKLEGWSLPRDIPDIWIIAKNKYQRFGSITHSVVIKQSGGNFSGDSPRFNDDKHQSSHTPISLNLPSMTKSPEQNLRNAAALPIDTTNSD